MTAPTSESCGSAYLQRVLRRCWREHDTSLCTARVAAPGLECDLLARVAATSDPRHPDHVELLLDANLADDVHLLAALLELGLLQVGGGGKRGGEDLFGLRLLQSERLELAKVALPGLGRVVCDEEDLLARRTQHCQDGRHLVDERVALPDDAVAVKDEDVDLVEQVGWHVELLAQPSVLKRHGGSTALRSERRGPQAGGSANPGGGSCAEGEASSGSSHG
mmetsp:Transcript_33356/g.111310  ORF Transcript_33356/g.111310 Transcript_33356/m.111310 type:complete len:221 (-) Transcript_33356:45-707(-)